VRHAFKKFKQQKREFTDYLESVDGDILTLKTPGGGGFGKL